MSDTGYDDVLAREYDADYEVLRRGSGDIGFYVAEAIASGGPVLELGCGTGRITLAIAQAAIEVTGVDLSAAMLARARFNFRYESPEVWGRIRYLQGDIRTVDAGGPFPLILLPFRPIIHLLDVDSQLAAFRNVARHLAPGGRVVFDLFQPNLAILGNPPTEEHLDLEREAKGCRVRRYSSFRPHRSTQTSEVTFRWEFREQDGSVREERSGFAMRWYYRYEVEHLLARCGLAVTHVFGDFDGSPQGDESVEMIFVATAG